MIAAIINVPANVGYVAVFALVAIETMGVPVPAEAALIAAALLANKGGMDVGTLILLASAAAILGDNIGFLLGRRFGRRVFLVDGPFLRHRRLALDKGEPFFAKHGPKAVFLGRWVSLLRIASAWLAGMNNMRWPTFLFWNALGGIAWATVTILGIYWLGHAAVRIVEVSGPALGGVLAVVVVFLIWRWRQRREDVEEIVEALTTNSGDDGE
jgi:membrane-associated protein